MSIMSPRPPSIFDRGMHDASPFSPCNHNYNNSASLRTSNYPPSPPTSPPVPIEKQRDHEIVQSCSNSPPNSNSNPKPPAQFRGHRTTGSPSRLPFSHRLIKPTPFQQSREGGREKRRDLFLKKMKQESEERRWDSRAEHYLRLDYIANRRRWESELARSAPPAPAEEAEAEEEAEQTYENTEMEDILQNDDEQMDLLSSMTHPDSNDQNNEPSWTMYGSDEDEYDAIFMEVSELQAGSLAAPQYQKYQEMDTSNG